MRGDMSLQEITSSIYRYIINSVVSTWERVQVLNDKFFDSQLIFLYGKSHWYISHGWVVMLLMNYVLEQAAFLYLDRWDAVLMRVLIQI